MADTEHDDAMTDNDTQDAPDLEAFEGASPEGETPAGSAGVAEAEGGSDVGVEPRPEGVEGAGRDEAEQGISEEEAAAAVVVGAAAVEAAGERAAAAPGKGPARGAPRGPAPATPAKPSEVGLHVDDRISMVFVGISVAVFVVIALYALLFGHGGFFTPIAKPTPAPVVTPAPVTPAPSASLPTLVPIVSPSPTTAASASPATSASPAASTSPVVSTSPAASPSPS